MDTYSYNNTYSYNSCIERKTGWKVIREITQHKMYHNREHRSEIASTSRITTTHQGTTIVESLKFFVDCPEHIKWELKINDTTFVGERKRSEGEEFELTAHLSLHTKKGLAEIRQGAIETEITVVHNEPEQQNVTKTKKGVRKRINSNNNKVRKA